MIIRYHWLKNLRLMYVREWESTQVMLDGSAVASVAGRDGEVRRVDIDQGHHVIEIRSCLGVRDRRRVNEEGELLWRGDVVAGPGDRIQVDVNPARLRGSWPFRRRKGEANVRVLKLTTPD